MSFRGFLDELRNTGLMKEIYSQVSPVIEAATISRNSGPVFFHNIDQRQACMNILGTRELLARALGIPKEEMVKYLSNIDYNGQTKETNSSPFQEIISEPDLRRLPILTHFSGDGGPYITSGIVISGLDGHINASVHRLMVLDKDKLAARLVPNRHTHMLHQKAKKEGRKLPVAIAIGIDPLILIAASTRVSPEMEFQYAGALRGKPVELLYLENGLPVPHAEIILEGYIGGELAMEGPFVDITGTWDLVRPEPVIKLTRMMTREDPIYHALLPSGGEHKMLMGIPYEPIIYREVSKVAVVKDAILTEGGCSYLHAVIQIEKETESDAKKAIEAAMEAHRSVKHILVVDTDIDIHNPNDLEYAIATRVKGDEDIFIYPKERGSTLDPRSVNGITTKVGIDATAILGESEKFERAR
jgi:UbiD family decarboxylase